MRGDSHFIVTGRIFNRRMYCHKSYPSHYAVGAVTDNYLAAGFAESRVADYSRPGPLLQAADDDLSRACSKTVDKNVESAVRGAAGAERLKGFFIFTGCFTAFINMVGIGGL